jgi:DedD protein
MARSISEQEQQLKKRARRRLVGAIVLVTAVAVVLPMVLDSEPKPVRQNVDIHIPSPDGGELKPKAPEAAQQQAPAPIKGLPESPPAAAAPAEAVADGSATAVSPPPAARAPADSAPKSDAAPPRVSAAPDRPAAASKERVEPARPTTPTAKVEAPPRAPVSDRTDSARSNSAPPKPRNEASARSDRSESARSASAESKRSADAASDSGGYVVQVAALADAAKARQLQKQMSGAGLKTYTEVVSTKAGQVTRVRAGPYATREAAEKARAQLKKAGLDGQVVAK